MAALVAFTATLAFIEDLLHRLGATPEQIDRERERAHADLVDTRQPEPAGAYL